jgi:DNA repair exonuclease SbcCD ATPase subunit
MSGVGPASDFRARYRRPTAVASILLLALAGGLSLAACGGEEELSRGEYERELQEAAREIETAFNRVGSELRNVGAGSTSLDDAAEEVETAHVRLAESADELEALDAPGDADQAHDDLVAGLRDLVDDLDDFGDAVEDGDVRLLQDFAARLGELESLRKIERATRALESQGYDLRG